MLKYSKEKLGKLYDKVPNKLAKVFLKKGYTNEEIDTIFNSKSKDEVIEMVDNILNNNNNYYMIPEKYKKAEIPELQDGRNDMYDFANGKIDRKIGETLEALYNYESDKYMIGIHRTASSKENIFEKGIEFKDSTYIHDHVQMFENFPFMLREIMLCENYKLSRGCFIVKIPKNAIKGSEMDAEPIYYKNKDGKIHLRPEFVCAYVPVENEKLKEVDFNNLSHDKLYEESPMFYQDESITQNSKSYGFINIMYLSVSVILIVIVFILCYISFIK